MQSDRPAMEGNVIDVFERQTLAVDQQRIHSCNDITKSCPKLGGVPSAARREVPIRTTPSSLTLFAKPPLLT